MRLHRFYTKESVEGQEIVIKNPDQIHQWFRVFRLGVGDQVILFNGDGKDKVCDFTELNKKTAKLSLIEVRDNVFGPKVEINLALSLIKKDNLELVLQKCTELGITRFTPIVSERSEKKGFNIDRAQKIVVEATEQSGRAIPPHITEPLSLSDFIGSTHDKVIVFHTSGSSINTGDVSGDKSVTIIIGPEGGWSDTEVELFKRHSVLIRSLGAQVLRAETAAIAVSSVLLL